MILPLFGDLSPAASSLREIAGNLFRSATGFFFFLGFFLLYASVAPIRRSVPFPPDGPPKEELFFCNEVSFFHPERDRSFWRE